MMLCVFSSASSYGVVVYMVVVLVVLGWCVRSYGSSSGGVVYVVGDVVVGCGGVY